MKPMDYSFQQKYYEREMERDGKSEMLHTSKDYRHYEHPIYIFN